MTGRKIVFSGICCLDIVSYLEDYPVEDSDLRNVEQMFTLGGNATNSNKVAAQLNNHSLLYSAIPHRNPMFDRIFEQFHVDTTHCMVRDASEELKGIPTTIVLVNMANGSRTMFSSLGGKLWPKADHFVREFASIEGFGWFHFEVADTLGLEEVLAMVKHVNLLRANAQRPVISIELEHPVEESILRQMLPLVDLVFAAKDFALHLGWHSMDECVRKFQEYFKAQDVTVVCPWGEKGAAAKPGNSRRIPHQFDAIIELSAHPPSSGQVVDTLAAGDCFIGGAVHFLNEGMDLRDALAKAVFLAGESVGQRGLAGLKLPEI